MGEQLTCKEALEWYAEKATAVHRYMKEGKHEALLAVITELELDNGRRARIATPERNAIERG